MKKIFGLLGAAALGLGLVSCGGNEESSKEIPSSSAAPIEVSVEAKSYVASRADDREAVYTHYTAEGEEVASYTSLYAAINGCVDDGDTDDYIKQKGSEEKLFINYDQYADNNYDMYWYYSGGNTFNEYLCWEDGYWDKLGNKDIISVLKSGQNGTVTHYANSYKAINKSSDYMLPKLGKIFSYHTCWELEANIGVDMVAYSGITKSVYKVNLSEAEITPVYDDGDTAYAYVGFITADAYNVSNHGLKCDTTTGNWYYYCGETSWNSSSIVMEDEDCYLTSTWDAEKGVFRPDGDVTMTMELLTLEDEDGDDYIVHRLTVDFGEGRVLVKDYETSDLTQCGTIRFTCGLDIESDNNLVDYMCGAKFENIVVTSAVATVYEEMMDDEVYGSYNELYAGTYDILNSNPESLARFHTIVYTPTCVTYDFNTPGKDIYGFSFDIQPKSVE